MDIQTRKINFIKEFLRLDNEQLIKKLENLLFQERKKIYEIELDPFSVEEYNEIIDKAVLDSKSGKIKEANDLNKEIDSWK
jgi:hypothetical protein